MGFFDTVRRVLHMDNHPVPDVQHAWGLDDDAGAEASPSASAEPGLYDRINWRKKMKRILEGLPASRPQWDELMSEARALNLDPSWIGQSELEEFTMLVRRAVSDRRLTEDEHRTLDLARDLIGLPDDRAEAILLATVAEVETFYGKTPRPT